ncbi:MAG: sulfite exporter TauE/SafE family protein [Phycisphaeraceae bacterium]|nr:sulfite exporter TauE/SafE family protein [Phycisphaeraceae bacterium]
MSSTAPAIRRRLHRALRRLMPFWWWLFWFYCAWATIIIVGGLWEQVLAHWPIAAAMAAGSYVAGSTPMGGGTVGFPILVLLFDQPASLGRNFSYCVQSIGMSSATVFLLANRSRIAWRFLAWCALGSLVTLPLTAVYVVPAVSDTSVKLLFACIWAGFGVMTLYKLRDFVRSHNVPRCRTPLDAALGLAAGLIGGVASGLTGVGIDMILYTLLVLVYRSDLRVAIGTSVMIMAINSLLGVLISGSMGRLGPEVFHNWIAAAPIVALGAPLGALMMTVISRAKTLFFVSILCVLQFVWTCWNERHSLGWSGAALALAAVLALNLAFHFMYQLGERMVPRVPVPPDGPLDTASGAGAAAGSARD